MKEQANEMDTTERNAIAEENWNAYQRGLDAGHNEYVALARKCDEYYRGDQWDDAIRQKLESEGRPVLTINAVKSAVNAVLGEYANQRVDITYKATSSGIPESADALTKLGLQVQSNNEYPDVEREVFTDGLIQDRGYFDIRMDFSDNVQGEIRIVAEDPIDIIPDPQAKNYKPETWQEVMKTRWLTPDEISLYYGKARGDEVRALDGDSNYGQDSVRYSQQTFGDVDAYGMHYTTDKNLRRVRVIERQYYKLRRVQLFIDPSTGDTRQVPDNWEPERVAAFAEQHELYVHAKVQRNIRWVITADHVVLHNEWSPYKSFTIVPFFPYFRRGRPVGMVRDLLSPQEQLNKTESQQLHIVNTTANSGWEVEAGSLVNMSADDLQKRGAETGLVLEYARGRPKPEKIQPNQVPSGLDRLSAKSLQYLREVAGVNSLLGLESDEVSGVALGRKQGRGLAQMQVPFENLAKSRFLVGKKILELAQQFYTETRVIKSTRYDTLEQNEEEVMINGMTPEGMIVNDITMGEYNVKISSQPARDTFAETQFAEALNLREAGIMIPDHWVIQYSHLSDKTEVAKEVRDSQGLGEPTEEQLQLQQMQMQMQIQGAQLELEKLGAEVQDLQADVMLKQAKAQSEVGELQLAAQQQQIDAQNQLAQLQATYTAKIQDLQTKLQLARIHTEAKQRDTLYTTSSKRFAEEMKAKATGLAKPSGQ